MSYSLASLARRFGGRRRKRRTLAPIAIPHALQKELYRLTAAPALEWRTQLKERILPAYARARSTLTRDNEADDIAEVIRIAEALVDGRTVTVTAEVEEWLRKAVKWHESKWLAAVKAGTGVDVFPFINQAQSLPRIKAFQRRISSLIRDINAVGRREVEEAVWRGITNDTPTEKVGAEISERLGIQRRRANRIAIDQSQKLNGELTLTRMEEAGLKRYEWRHSGKINFRPEHKARNGKIYKIGEPVGDQPGFKPYCGCVAMPLLDPDQDGAAEV